MTFLQAHAHALQVLAQQQNLPREEAHARARILLDFAVAKRYAHLLAPAQVLEAAQQSAFEHALERAARGEPLPYIVGEQEFLSRAFHVGPGTLIPRPETEYLVEAACKYLQQSQGAPEALEAALELADLGTGSGAIAISLALEVPRARILATDVSGAALKIASRNARRHGVEDRVELALSDGSWVAPLQGRSFAGIVSNPPYIPARDIEGLQIEVRQFEPRVALDGGADGLDVYRVFATELGKYLQPDGFVALEVGAGQWAEVALLFRAGGWSVEPAIMDFAGIERVLIAFQEPEVVLK